MRGKMGLVVMAVILVGVSGWSSAAPGGALTVLLSAGKRPSSEPALEGARVVVSCGRKSGESWESLVRDREGSGRLRVPLPEDASGCWVWAAGPGLGFERTGPVEPAPGGRVELELDPGAGATFLLREGASGRRVVEGTMNPMVAWKPGGGREWITLPEGLVTAEVDRGGRWTVGPLRPGRGGAFRITCRHPERGDVVLRLGDLEPGKTVDLGTLDLWAPAVLCGRVEPVPRSWEEVRVLMRPADGSGSPHAVPVDEHGWFCAEGAHARRPTLVWTVDGFKTNGQAVAVVPPEEDVVLPRPEVGLLRGRVTDEEDGTPVEEFTVSIAVPPVIRGVPSTPMSEQVQTLVRRQFREPTGTFTIPLPPADAFSADFLELRVEAPDRAPSVLSLEGGPPAEPLEIALARGGTLEGNVSSGWGAPVEGAEIRLRRQDTALPVLQSARTDAAGGFTLWHLAPGMYHLEVRYPGFLTLRRSIEIGGGANEVSLVLEEGRPVRGTVVARVDGQPVPGARLLAEWDGGSSTGVSGEDGSFELDPVPPGKLVTLSASAEGFSYWRGSVDPAAGAAHGGIRVELDEGKTFRGRVLGLGGDGSGASVWLTGVNDPAVLTATTQSGGGFVVVGRLSGVVAYTVRHGTLSRPCKGTVSLPEEADAELVLDCSEPGVGVEGSVFRQDGSEAPGVHLLLRASGSPGRCLNAVTDPSGAFSFDEVPPAEYSILAVDMEAGRSAPLWSGYVPSSGLELTLRLPSGW